MTPTRRDSCAALDSTSPFQTTREWFELPEGLIYLDGNSLGPPPRAALGAAARLISDEWGGGLVRSWEEAGWWDKPRQLGAMLAPLLGAQEDEVVVCDSISVNLFKVITAAARLAPERRALVVESDAFPTDGYIAGSVAALLGLELRRVRREDDFETALDGAALAVLGHVDYRTGYRHDLAALTGLAHRCGSLVVWDLAHSVGAMPIRLDDAGADFAVGCTYKYLNGGPGAPAFVYAASRHLQAVAQPLNGWNGHATPFAFSPDYAPDRGIRRFLAGSPPLVAFAPLEASLRLWQEVDLEQLEAASISLSSLLAELLAERCPQLELASPPEPARRGSHLAYRYGDAHALVEELAKRQVIADAREPDLVRLALTPLYLRHTDVFDAVERIAEVLGELP